ncbi:MAG: tetratricopeptide repeat protein [Planctomycetes bacterium]|nr:tetratricopeptide repeat protein [Planctomycetota bacterium]
MSDDPTPTSQPAAQPATPGAPEEASRLPLILIVGAALVAGAAGVALRQGSDPAPGTPAALARAEELMTQGEELARRPDAGVKSAVEVLADAHRLAPDDPRTNLAYGRALVLLDRFPEALPPLNRARELAPDDADGHLLAGMALTGVQRFDDALAALERARALRPDDPQVHYFLAVAAYGAEDFEAILAHLDALAGKAPDSPQTLQLRYTALRVLGRRVEALEPLRRLAALSPRDVRLRRDLQDAEVEVLGWAAAVEEAGRAAAAEGADALALYLHARLLAQHPRTAPEARPLYERAAAREPGFAWALAGLAVELMRDGEHDAARERLREALELDPTLAEAVLALAKLEHAAGRLDDARGHHDRLAQAGYQAAAREGVLACLLDGGRHDDALAFARGVLPQGAPADHPARWLEAHALARAGRADEAAAIARAIVDATPEAARWRARAAAGRGRRAAGRRADARAALDDALHEAPKGSRPGPNLLLWAGVSRAQEDVEGARARWRQGADTGEERNPEGLYTWACRRLLGEATRDHVLAAARIGGVQDHNDAWFVEGLALELAGHGEEARAAYLKAREATRAAEAPGRLIDEALERLGE